MIYYVEDDASIRNLVIYTLGVTGYSARGYEYSAEFWREMAQTPAELILLDIMLPGESGLGILKELKRRPETMGIPVIMITAKDSEADIVEGLELGADDYICKPFGIMELIARIKAVLRRCAVPEVGEVLRAGAIRMDTAKHTVTASGLTINLTLKEYELLRVLMQRPGKLVEREKLIADVWGQDYMGASHTLDTHIQTLRCKLGSCGGQIQTYTAADTASARRRMKNEAAHTLEHALRRNRHRSCVHSAGNGGAYKPFHRSGRNAAGE